MKIIAKIKGWRHFFIGYKAKCPFEVLKKLETTKLFVKLPSINQWGVEVERFMTPFGIYARPKIVFFSPPKKEGRKMKKVTKISGLMLFSVIVVSLSYYIYDMTIVLKIQTAHIPIYWCYLCAGTLFVFNCWCVLFTYILIRKVNS